ncbi:hypothetical protein [Hallella multisaccharivorax]|uniref:hypothetical protein n=1 Tax=Hallella multisaccharivorax TaxID=310514 RepID=UPI0036134E95
MKVSISNDILDQNVEKINEFLSKKGMSLIMGGDKGLTVLEPKWGNTNYAESTRPIGR